MTNSDIALAKTKLFEKQLSEALDKRFGNKGAKLMDMPKDEATDAITAPFTLCADAIVEKIDKETGAAVYEVEKDGKVIYSTVTKPLAFAFLAGVNATVPPSAPKKGEPPKEGGKPETVNLQSAKDSGGSDTSGAALPAPKPEARKRTIL